MKKSAFTLAEVLITLTIIGVIAALTIPNLMQKWSDHADVARVKEAYSILSNAYSMAISENGKFLEWDWPKGINTYSYDNHPYFAKTLSKYLKVKSINNGCFGYTPYFLNISGEIDTNGGNKDPRYGRGGCIILENGMYIATITGNLAENTPNDCVLDVDINGPKAPNKWGYDIFKFGCNWSNSSRLYPYYLENGRNRLSSKYCNPIKESSSSGVACADWVIRRGNMDYKYRDISAEW